MSAPSLTELESLLSDLQLVQPLQLQQSRRALGANLTSERLLDELETGTFLTSYQAGKLRKGDTEALRLGPYKLLYRNASGSFARVFRAVSVEDGQTVGIKLLRQRYAEDPRIVHLFRREGELGKRLKHPNIVPIYDVARDGNQHYLTMEFVEGGNFRDFLKIRRKFDVSEATRYALEIARALEYALRLGLTHRDLKLSNVLLSAQGVAKLVDFGLAGQDRSLATMEAEVDRAIEYATLEQGSAAPENDPRSDLYFLGAIYYELLTGVPPYPPTRSREERASFNRYRHVRPVRSIEPNLPAFVGDVVMRLMNVSPQERYQTPTELIADLEHILRGDVPQPKDAKPEAPPKTIICVENRAAQQNALREYFTRHEFRVLVIGDPVRALNRVETESPFGLVLIGDALGEAQIAPVMKAAISRCKLVRTPIVLVLSSKQESLGTAWRDNPSVRVMSGAITLREIRTALNHMHSEAQGMPSLGLLNSR